MIDDDGATLHVGGADAELEARIGRELTAFNNAATGADDEADLSVRVTDADGELVGGLTGWTEGERSQRVSNHHAHRSPIGRRCGEVVNAGVPGVPAGPTAPGDRAAPGCQRPERALRNRLVRDELVAADAVARARELGVRVVEVDGGRDAEAVAALVADHFAAYL